MHHPHLQRKWCHFLLQPLPLYPTSLNCYPGQLPNLLVSMISFWWKQGWYTPKLKSRKTQRAGKKLEPQILYSCFEAIWSVLAYIFTLAMKTGAQQLSEGSIQRCYALASFCEILTKPSACFEQNTELETSQHLLQFKWFRNSETSGRNSMAGAYTRVWHMEHYLYQSILKFWNSKCHFYQPRYDKTSAFWIQGETCYRTKTKGLTVQLYLCTVAHHSQDLLE